MWIYSRNNVIKPQYWLSTTLTPKGATAVVCPVLAEDTHLQAAGTGAHPRSHQRWLPSLVCMPSYACASCFKCRAAKMMQLNIQRKQYSFRTTFNNTFFFLNQIILTELGIRCNASRFKGRICPSSGCSGERLKHHIG